MGGSLQSSASKTGSDEARYTALDSGIAGAVSGAVSRFVVGPLDVMKIRFQVQLEPIRETGRAVVAQHQHQLHGKYTSLRQAFLTILKEEGVRGLWRGTGSFLFLLILFGWLSDDFFCLLRSGLCLDACFTPITVPTQSPGSYWPFRTRRYSSWHCSELKA